MRDAFAGVLAQGSMRPVRTRRGSDRTYKKNPLGFESLPQAFANNPKAFVCLHFHFRLRQIVIAHAGVAVREDKIRVRTTGFTVQSARNDSADNEKHSVTTRNDCVASPFVNLREPQVSV